MSGQDLTPQRAREVWEEAFLSALRITGIVKRACFAASISRSRVYELRSAAPDFAAAWDEALEDATDTLEQEARRRAIQGVQRYKFDKHGNALKNPVTGEYYVEHEYSDTLLIRLLEANRPEKFKPRSQIEHTGKDGGAILVKFEEAAARIYSEDEQ